jgi:hypothetical protein
MDDDSTGPDPLGILGRSRSHDDERAVSDEAPSPRLDTPIKQESGSDGDENKHENLYRQGRPETPLQQQHHDLSQTPPPPHISSPLLPSPMSLHRLGIANFSPLRRQFSSPLASNISPPLHVKQEELSDEDRAYTGPQDPADDEVTQDSKDVLLERLNDLTQRLLSRRASISERSVGFLHEKVNEMERVIASSKPPRVTRIPMPPRTDDSDPFWASPSPLWFRSQFSDISRPPSKEPPAEIKKAPSISAADALRISAEADKLNEELATLMENLKARQEESDVSTARPENIQLCVCGHRRTNNSFLFFL